MNKIVLLVLMFLLMVPAYSFSAKVVFVYETDIEKVAEALKKAEAEKGDILKTQRKFYPFVCDFNKTIFDAGMNDVACVYTGKVLSFFDK